MSNGTTTWNYTYDANGMRTSRTNGTKTYNYVYNGSQLTQMTVGNDTLYFTYGILGPTTVTWNGETYYYALNAQGDVVGIYDHNSYVVVTYNWDTAWGCNPIPEGSLASTLGTLNPLRYRGYVYDIETGYYYLQSRYYDPEIGRFINADGLVATGQGLLSNNMFAYCGNNPVTRKDDSGNFWFTSVIVGLATQYVGDVIGNLISGKTGLDILKPTSSVGEYVAASVTALIPGSGFGGALVRNVVTESIIVIEDTILGDEVNVVDSMVNIAAGTVLDVGFEKLSDTASDIISKKTPQNYSSYAHKARQANPEMSKTQITDSMQRSIRHYRRLSKAIAIGLDVGRTCLPY